jgi:sialidase-1
MWDGSRPSGHAGVVLRSSDGGRTWNDQTLYFDHPSITPLEARLCQMADGRVVAIVWAFDEKRGASLNNHVVVSHDEGRTWSRPLDIGIAAQASNLWPLDGERLLSVHAHREAEPTGVFVRVVDFAGDRWRTVSEASVWDRASAMKVTGFRDMGTNLRFGQPALLGLGDGEYLVYHWAIEGGQGRILGHRIRLS